MIFTTLSIEHTITLITVYIKKIIVDSAATVTGKKTHVNGLKFIAFFFLIYGQNIEILRSLVLV